MSSSTTESTLAIVMTAGDEFPGNAVLAQAIKARIPNIVIPPEIVADPNGTLVFLYEDYMFAVGKVDAPCPISKDDPCVQIAGAQFTSLSIKAQRSSRSQSDQIEVSNWI